MNTLPAAFATDVAGGLTTLCRCRRVDRRDGVVFGLSVRLNGNSVAAPQPNGERRTFDSVGIGR